MSLNQCIKLSEFDSADSIDYILEKSVSYQKKDGRGHARPSSFWYTTNPIERSAAATERLTSKSDLESSIKSHRTIAEQWPSKSVERSASARWDFTGDSTSLSLVERSVAAAEHWVRLVVYDKDKEFKVYFLVTRVFTHNLWPTYRLVKSLYLGQALVWPTFLSID